MASKETILLERVMTGIGEEDIVKEFRSMWKECTGKGYKVESFEVYLGEEPTFRMDGTK